MSLCDRYVATVQNPAHQVDGRVLATLAAKMLKDVDVEARLEGWAEVLERIAAGATPAELATELRGRLGELKARTDV